MTFVRVFFMALAACAATAMIMTRSKGGLIEWAVILTGVASLISYFM